MAKFSLTRSFLVGCLASTAYFSTPAHAGDPSLYFYPAEKWSVSGASGQDGAFCTVSSEFNNGYVISFAGTAEKFVNVNFDFRQDTFEKNKSYSVKLSVPGVAESKIDSKAYEKNMIVSDLRGHKEFSQALVKASVLDIEIEGNAFRFYMTGLGAALKDYQQCAGEKPADVALEDTPVTPLPDPEKTALSNEVVDLATRDKQEAELKPTSLQQKMAALAAEDSSKPAKTVVLEEKDKKPLPEAEKLTKIEEPVKTPPKVEKIKTPEPKITREPTIRMEADLTKYDEKPIQKPQGKEKLPPLKEAGEIPPPSVRPVDGDFADMRNKIKELETQIFKLKKENGNLEADLKDALNDAREERLSVSSDNWNLERATLRYNESERQIERLGRQLQTQKSQCDAEKKDLENMLFDPQVTNQQQLTRLSALEEELDRAKTDLQTQKRTCDERTKILEERLSK